MGFTRPQTSSEAETNRHQRQGFYFTEDPIFVLEALPYIANGMRYLGTLSAKHRFREATKVMVRMRTDPPTSAEWTARQLRLAIDAAGVALWSWNVNDDTFTMDRRGHDLWDLPMQGTVTFEDLSSRIHPADKDRVRAAF